uniref:Uncharacterized protein n=1 Tax=Anguilla anguilla TaxID=7936 RepID=A0A0E9RX17_ANGAN
MNGPCFPPLIVQLALWQCRWQCNVVACIVTPMSRGQCIG